MSQLDVTELEEADHGRYDTLVRDSPQGSLWSSAAFQKHCGLRHTVLGVFKGRELVGGGALPLAAGALARHEPSFPWTGLCSRSESEGENQAIAGNVASYCERRWQESTLSLAPEWTDIREFTWAGWKSHIRYTYRGWGAPYEKRLTLRPASPKRSVLNFGTFAEHYYGHRDSRIMALFDNRHGYYAKADRGGSWHSELIHAFIQDCRAANLDFDLVGANSPHRGLFKRSFGGRLTPYYVVTTCSSKDLRLPVPIHESAAVAL